MESYKIKFRVDIKNMIYINAVIDSYDGIGIIRTIDSKNGLVAVYTSEGQKVNLYDVLNALKSEGVNITDISEEKTEEIDNW